MTESPPTATLDLWRQLVASHQSYQRATAQFLADNENRVKVIGVALRGKERPIALAFAKSLSPEERLQLFPEWIYLASWSHGGVQVARDMILSLPHDWVMNRIELEADAYLQQGDDDTYRRLLELFDLLDRDLTLRLVQRAIQSSDPHVREAGEDFKEKLAPPG